MIRRTSAGCKKVHGAVSNITENSGLRHNNTQLCILYSTQKLGLVGAEAYLIIHPAIPPRTFSRSSFHPVLISIVKHHAVL